MMTYTKRMELMMAAAAECIRDARRGDHAVADESRRTVYELANTIGEGDACLAEARRRAASADLAESGRELRLLREEAAAEEADEDRA